MYNQYVKTKYIGIYIAVEVDYVSHDTHYWLQDDNGNETYYEICPPTKAQIEAFVLAVMVWHELCTIEKMPNTTFWHEEYVVTEQNQTQSERLFAFNQTSLDHYTTKTMLVVLMRHAMKYKPGSLEQTTINRIYTELYVDIQNPTPGSVGPINWHTCLVLFTYFL